MFSSLSLSEQFDALVGPHTRLSIDGDGELRAVQATVAGRRLILVGSDYAAQHGSLGSRECDQLIAALRTAQSEGAPLVLVLNTSGVRVSEGNAGVAGLRRALRAALDAALGGVPMLALIARNCFGGASVLASLCDRRIVNRGCLIGMSGPKLIESMSGPGDLVATDKDAVRRLLGGAARAHESHGFMLIDDDAKAYATALGDWVRGIEAGAKPAPLAARRAALGERLRSAGRLGSPGEEEVADDPVLAAVTAKLLGRTPLLRRRGPVVRAVAAAGETSCVLGLVHTGSADATSVWRLTEALAAVPDDARQLHILLDCESHSARAVDEQVILSEYLICLALEVRACHLRGVDVGLVVTGVSGGGIFAALAAGVRTVSMLRSSRLQILPRAAMASINRSEDEAETTTARALETGAADEMLCLVTEGHAGAR